MVDTPAAPDSPALGDGQGASGSARGATPDAGCETVEGDNPGRGPTVTAGRAGDSLWLDADADAGYRRFYDAVARTQLRGWLPDTPGVVLELSDPACGFGDLAAAAGHRVVQTLDGGAAGRPSRLPAVLADRRTSDFARDGSVDMVLAEDGVLSACLAAEEVVADLRRVLRPGGRMLLCVDSLVSGLARLAELGRWAELADTPAADVLLVQAADGSVGRCFWPAELTALLEDAGFEVEYVRPRTVLTPASVARALESDPGLLAELVRTEMALSTEHQGESVGARLVASARRPG